MYVPPFSSQVILRQVQRVFCPVRRGASVLPGWWVLCPECLGHFLGPAGAGSRVSVSVGVNWSHHGVPGEGLGPSHGVAPRGPRLSHVGGPHPA